MRHYCRHQLYNLEKPILYIIISANLIKLNIRHLEEAKGSSAEHLQLNKKVTKGGRLSRRLGSISKIGESQSVA